MQQSSGNKIQRQSLVIVVMGEQVPATVEHQPATVACAAGDNLQPAPVGTTSQDTTDTGVGNASPFGLAEERPVTPVVGAPEIPVEDQHVSQRQVKIAFRPPGQAVKALVRMIIGMAPDKSLCLDLLPPVHGTGQQVQGPIGHRIEILATDLDVVDPRVRWKAKHLPTRLQSSPAIRFVHENGLAGPDEQPTKRIGPHREKRFVR